MPLTDPVTTVPLIGDRYQNLLKNLGIVTVEDLLRHYPSRYEDFSQIKKIAELLGGEKATIRAEVLEIKNIYTRYNKQLTKATVRDATGTLLLVWFNQTYITNAIHEGETFYFSGELKPFSGKPALLNPQYEKSPGNNSAESLETTDDAEGLIHTGRFVPVYPETDGVSSKWLRSRINWLIKNQSQLLGELELLPNTVREEYHLIEADEAITKIHFPKELPDVTAARARLAFEELFLLQLTALEKRVAWQNQSPSPRIKVTAENPKITQLISNLPFKLTAAQNRCLQEILDDLAKEKPMNRLLQGDVGSGKTIVAAIAAYATALTGYQTAYMAPTEILANQHYQTFQKYLEPIGLKISLQTRTAKNTATEADIIIGTHALLHRPELFQKLAFVVIDEQHRFGVKQRAELVNIEKKSRRTPHLLTMTATPIPRSLALTTYGHLDISILDEMPHGFRSVKTWLVPEEKREAGYQWLRQKLQEPSLGGHGLTNQAFVICPLIEESEHETLEDVKAVTTEFERLQKTLAGIKLALLHGRMKSKEKDEIIGSFRSGETQMLVATPVVEVGIDIPQANLMVIEAAHRFGLASLHQLRGRIGRAGQEAYCLLFTPKSSDPITRRLKALEKHHSGLELAEIDLKMRGTGELYGLKQHGLPNLKIATLNDLVLIRATRLAAAKILPEIATYPKLKQKIAQQTDKIEPN